MQIQTLSRFNSFLQGLLFRVAIVVCVSCCQPSIAQTSDLVVSRGSDGKSTVNRRGTIVEWKGDHLTILVQQQERKIENQDILRFETTWPASFDEAQQMIAQSQFEPAVSKLAEAIENESRPWAKRHIRAELIRVLTALNQTEAAIDQFLTIVGEDVDSQFFYLCPVKWISNASLPAARAAELRDSKDPVQQLLGASWSLPGRDQGSAIRILEQLTSDLDIRIQKLATTQLWRVRALNLSSINDRQLEVWETKLAEMPDKLRAGPWFLLAEIQMKRKQNESAIINWMRVPILYPDQYALSAAALQQTSLLLDNLGRTQEAESIKSELQKKFADTVWAKVP